MGSVPYIGLVLKAVGDLLAVRRHKNQGQPRVLGTQVRGFAKLGLIQRFHHLLDRRFVIDDTAGAGLAVTNNNQPCRRRALLPVRPQGAFTLAALIAGHGILLGKGAAAKQRQHGQQAKKTFHHSFPSSL